MKPLATIGDVNAWRAELRANDVQRRPPPQSTVRATADRGYIEQPGEKPERPPPERETTRFPPAPPAPPEQVLVKIERETREEPIEVPAKQKKSRVHRGPEFQRDTVRQVLAETQTHGAAARIAKKLGLAPSLVHRWVKEHGDAVRAESRNTLVSNGARAPSAPVSGPVSKPNSTSVDQAAKNLVDTLGAYIMAVIDARVNEAIAERMKRLV